jgi:hypothetical protein
VSYFSAKYPPPNHIFISVNAWNAQVKVGMKIIVSEWTADVIDVVYVNTITWSLGCVGVGEAAKGKQLTANQGQEWMNIRTTSKKADSPSK